MEGFGLKIYLSILILGGMITGWLILNRVLHTISGGRGRACREIAVHWYIILERPHTKYFGLFADYQGREHQFVILTHLVHRQRLSENESRRYFQQLIDAIDYCHSKGVYHRDLKPENLLLDSQGNLKISDFGLSALPQQMREDGLLHTTCGTPNYVAPEVLSHKGYDGALADLWSCGVILYVLMAGFLPFDEEDLMTLYRKINEAEFSCPTWFSPGAKNLISRLLDPDPQTRIKVSSIQEDDWFKKNYAPVRLNEDDDVNFDDVQAVFDDAEDKYVSELKETKELGPSVKNAFELIALSQGLNLSALFDRQQDNIRRQTMFISEKPAKVILSTFESAAESMGFKVRINNYKMRIEGVTPNKTGSISVALEVFEVAPSVFMVEVRKVAGDILEYHKFYKALSAKLEDIIWKPVNDSEMGSVNPSAG